jgi:rhodanese-related sulfurtransferase
MKRVLAQAFLLVLLSVVMGLGRNAAAPGGIAWVGDWAEKDSVIAAVSSNLAAKPPSAQAGDPPFLSLAEAMAKYDEPNVIFVDARVPEDYKAGHITGAVLLPFDSLDDYWPQVEGQLPKEREIVTYCSGAECELSLFLARYMKDAGYEKISIFYGGWVQWQENGGPVTTGESGTEG